MARDIDRDFEELDWTLKNMIQWRSLIAGLQQYRSRMVKDKVTENISHLDAYIEEMKDTAKR